MDAHLPAREPQPRHRLSPEPNRTRSDPRTFHGLPCGDTLKGMDDEMIDIDEPRGDQLLGLAALLRHPPAPQRRRRAPVTIPIARADAEAAGGVEVVHRTVSAVASPDDPELRGKAADVIAALASLKPRTPMDASLGALFVAMERASLDSLSVARIAGFDSALGVVLLSRAEKLACRATELAQVIRGGRGQRRKIMIDHISHA